LGLVVLCSFFIGCDGAPDPSDAGFDGGGTPLDSGNDMDSGGEVDAGGDPDAGMADAGLPDLTAAQITEECEGYCDRAERCDALSTFGGAECQAMCETALGADTGFLANINCVNSADCTEVEANCVGDIPTAEECLDMCTYVDSCGYVDLLDLPASGICVPFCSGAIASENVEVTTILECIGDLAGGACDVFGLLACVPDGLPSCESICDDISECAEGTGVGTDFPAEGSCETYCETLEPAQRISFFVCTGINDCESQRCDEIPAAPPAECVTGCGNIVDVCAPEGPAGDEACPVICSGVHLSPDDHDLSGFASCTDALTMCQPDIGELFDRLTDTYSSALVYCMLEPSDICVSACADFDACDIGDDTRFECEIRCAMLEREDPAQIQLVGECLDDVDRTQPMVDQCTAIGACTP
jgi:hypothetical protein